MFLTPDQLEQLTGYRRPSAQVRWLRERGIEPFVSARGQVQVTLDVVEEVQRRMSGVEARFTRRGPRPNLKVVS